MSALIKTKPWEKMTVRHNSEAKSALSLKLDANLFLVGDLKLVF